MDVLLEPLAFEFMQRALAISLIIGVICAVFSCFLVLKGWSLMGDAISHAVLPGLGLSVILGLPLMVGAFVSGLFCAVATGYLKNNSRLKEDAVMGIVFSGMFAAGLVMLGKIETEFHLMHVLFGNVLGVSWGDVTQSGALAALCLGLVALKRRDLMLYCFDPEHAKSLGLNTKLLHFGLLIALSLTIVVSLKAAGIILVVAMLIAPGAIGFLVSKSFDTMMAVSVAVSVISCIAGTFLSFHLDVATAPLIIIIQACFFLIALGGQNYVRQTR